MDIPKANFPSFLALSENTGMHGKGFGGGRKFTSDNWEIGSGEIGRLQIGSGSREIVSGEIVSGEFESRVTVSGEIRRVEFGR